MSTEQQHGDDFKQSERERWAKAQPPRIVEHWSPTISEQEKKEREQQVKDGLLPF